MSNGRIGWVGYVACMGRKRNAYKMLVEKCQGRPRHRWENNIKMDLVKTGCEGVSCTELVQDTVQWWTWVNTVMKFQVPKQKGSFLAR
jgi:hypothetical protein